jgi:hypothetical protein
MISNKLKPFMQVTIVAMILAGASNTLSTHFITKDDKFQNQQFVVEEGIHKYFYHPYIQVLYPCFRQSFAISPALWPFPFLSSLKNFGRSLLKKDGSSR